MTAGSSRLLMTGSVRFSSKSVMTKTQFFRRPSQGASSGNMNCEDGYYET